MQQPQVTVLIKKLSFLVRLAPFQVLDHDVWLVTVMLAAQQRGETLLSAKNVL